MASLIKGLWGFILLILLIVCPPMLGFYLIGLVLHWGGFQGFTPKLMISFGAAGGIGILFYMLEVVIIRVVKKAWKKNTSPYSL